jgi:hypothetical protein
LERIWGVQALKIGKVLLLSMIGLRRVLWGIFPVDLSAVHIRALLNYYQHVCSCWTLSIWNFVLKMRHTYKWHDTEFVSESTSRLLLDSVLCMYHVVVLMCVYEKADLVMRWLQQLVGTHDLSATVKSPRFFKLGSCFSFF